MSDKLQLALEYAINEIQGFYDRGNTFAKLNQHYRSQMLAVSDNDFDWRSLLEKASSEFSAFDSLKRYCAHQIRMEKPLPDPLKYWIADVLEGIEPTLKEPKGGTETGKAQNAFLPRLVQKITDKYDLPATRGSGSDPTSACDIVQKAIISVPEAREIRSRVYDTIRKDYARAKKNGAFE